MNRQEKVNAVQKLTDAFGASDASFLVGYKGLGVEQLQALRRRLQSAGGVLKVAKARLAKRAVSEKNAVLGPLLKDQVALVFASGQVQLVAKELVDFSKNNEQLKLVGGVFDASLLDAAAIVQIAHLPSKQVLIAQLLGTMQAPMTNMVCVLNALIVRLLWVLKQIEEKKQQVA